MCISSLKIGIFHFHLLSGGGGIASLRPDPQVSGFVDGERVMLKAGVSDNDDVVIKVIIIAIVLTMTLGVRIGCWRKFIVDFTLYKRTLLMFQGKAYGQILSDFVLTGLPTLEEMKES